MAQQIYRRHHYVPRFLLRPFSTNGVVIDMFALSKDRLIPKVGIKEQCQGRYFYGKRPDLEIAFAKLEAETASTIDKLLSQNYGDVTSEEVMRLRVFIHYQAHRTQATANQISEALGKQMKFIAEKHLSLKGYNPDDFKSVKIGIKNPQFLGVRSAAESIAAIFDLHMKILLNDQPLEFIISDQPVVLHNQYAEHHPRFRHATGTTGIALMGIQIFMPISPRVQLALYDPQCYQYGGQSNLLCKVSKKDVDWLNTLQATRADRCLFRSPFGPAEPLMRRYSKLRAEKLKDSGVIIRESNPVSQGDGTTKSMIHLSRNEIKMNSKLSFVKLLDADEDFGSDNLPVRSHHLYQALEYGKKLVRGRTRPRKAKPGDMDTIYMMGIDVWADGTSRDEYMAACRTSEKYAKGTWYVLEDVDGAPVSALITYKLDPVNGKPAIGIGSIATDPARRKNGHASQLLWDVMGKFHVRDGSQVFFLHADVDPRFYETRDFVRLPDKYQGRAGSTVMIRCSKGLLEKLLADPEFKVPGYF